MREKTVTSVIRMGIGRHRKTNPFIKEMITNKALYLMLLPGTVLVFLFSYLPMPGVLLAFKDFKHHGNIFQSFMQSEWVGLKNFLFLFRGDIAIIATRNTLLYNMVFIVLGLVFAVILAILINEVKNKKLVKFYQTSFLLPYFLSWIIVAYFGYSLLNNESGIINRNILSALDISPVNWYFQPKYWPYILVTAGIWKYLGYNTIIYTASITTFDTELYEAATIDGANKVQQARYITIPLLTPLMVIMSILAIGRIFNSDFGLFYNVPMNMGSLTTATEVIDTYVYRMLSTNDFGMATASGLYQALVGFTLVITTNAIVKKIDKDYSLF